MADTISLIIGLGNPGDKYRGTRHNVGADLVEEFARRSACRFQPDRKFMGQVAVVPGRTGVRLFLPSTYMNESGRAVSRIVGFFRIPLDEVLVVHDELDLPPGTVRYKKSGGSGGHNGLKDIVSCLGGQTGFRRLRIGIGHPGSADRVIGYVLGRSSPQDRELIDQGIEEALSSLPLALDGNWDKAMTRLHSVRIPPELPSADD